MQKLDKQKTKREAPASGEGVKPFSINVFNDF
jgi:hypothetical protein